MAELHVSKDSIDKRVSEVLKKETRKLSIEQQNIQKAVSDLEKITGNQTSNYTIAPKDTIGKSVLYNISRI